MKIVFPTRGNLKKSYKVIIVGIVDMLGAAQ
jgi:preprotein translocase subunit SecE